MTDISYDDKRYLEKNIKLLDNVEYNEILKILLKNKQKYSANKTGIFFNLKYINDSMKSIRKIQIDCNLLHRCTKDKELLNNIYDGYLFNKQIMSNNKFHYNVYIPKINLISRTKLSDDLEDYTSMEFKIFLIEDGLTLKRKIRLLKFSKNND